MRTKKTLKGSRKLSPVIFTETGAKLSQRFVRIMDRGGFLFSSSFVHDEKLTQFKYCVLGYDKDAKAILLSFTNDEKAKGIIKLTRRATKNSSLQSLSFFRFFGLDLKQLGGKRYDIEKRILAGGKDWHVIFLSKK